jgi:hypothetical protein
VLKKKKKGTNLVKFFLFLFALCSLSAALIYNILKENAEITTWDRYMLLGKENIFLVYEDKLAIKIPYEISINKEKTFRELVDGKKYSKILEEINTIFPEKIERYKVVKFGEINIKATNQKNIPENLIEDKKYIATSLIEDIFNEYYREKPIFKEINNNEIIVDILNANGKAGYARLTGEKLKNGLGLRYNAANYENQSEYSYIILNNLSMKKAEEIIDKVNEKYFKLKEENNVPTLANLVIVLGKEQMHLLEVNLIGNEKKISQVNQQLKKLGYKDIKNRKSEESHENRIEYHPEDYFTAYKLSKNLRIEKLMENKNLKEKINVFLN